MASVLIAGGPGSGKSSVAAELRERGLAAVDCDYGFARWEDANGAPVEFPANPDLGWLRRHRWQWLEDRLGPVLEESRSCSVALCGTAFNMADYLPRFDLLVLLRIDAGTMTQRLLDPRRANVFGKVGETLEWSLDWHPRLEAELIDAGAQCVDAQQPLPLVVDGVIQTCRTNGIELDGS